MPAVRSLARSRSFAALVASLALAAAACGGAATSPTAAPSLAPSAAASPSEAASPSVAASPSEAASQEPSESAGAGGSGDAVTIANFAFDPKTITVAKGTTVTWTNTDSIGHTVTFDQGGDGSGVLNQGGTFQETFKTAGTFTYHCKIHPSMTGTVTVTG